MLNWQKPMFHPTNRNLTAVMALIGMATTQLAALALLFWVLG